MNSVPNAAAAQAKATVSSLKEQPNGLAHSSVTDECLLVLYLL